MGLNDVYKTKQWLKLRALALARDYHICQVCKNRGNYVHHIEPIAPSNRWDIKGIVYNLDNLITLCLRCHNLVHFGNKCIEDGYEFDEDGHIVPINVEDMPLLLDLRQQAKRI